MTTNFEPPKAEDRIQCCSCNETDLMKLSYGPDPYDEEILGDSTPVWLCDWCYETHCDEI